MYFSIVIFNIFLSFICRSSGIPIVFHELDLFDELSLHKDTAGTVTGVMVIVNQAILSNDGTYVTLNFNISTNYGGLGRSFSCPNLFDFVGENYATCSWADAKTITIYPDLSGNTFLALSTGSQIKILSNNITAACTGIACNQLPTMLPQTLIVKPPQNPISPTVVVKSFSPISSCDSITLDLTQTSGNAGRDWIGFFINVSAPGETGAALWDLENYLFEEFSTDFPVFIPSSYIQGGVTYTFFVSLCNYFGLCSNDTVVVKVLNEVGAIPQISIAGGTVQSMYTTSSLSLTSSVSVVICGEQVVTQLQYSWKVALQSTPFTYLSVVSTSKDPSIFSLSPYALTAGNTYVVYVNATAPANHMTGHSSVTVQVLASNVITTLNPSTNQLLKEGQSLLIDGSQSFDPDALSAKLTYTWMCNGELLSLCPLNVTYSNSASRSAVYVTAPIGSVNSSISLTLQVISGTKSTTSSIKVTIIQSTAPFVSISTSASAVSYINAGASLFIYGSVKAPLGCLATWTILDYSKDLSTATSAPYSSYIKSDSALPVNFFLLPNVLYAPATYTFVLSCGSSKASIYVGTNSPPSGKCF
jgi:hypothetical protein